MRKIDSYIPERRRNTEPRTKPVSVRMEPEFISAIDTMAAKYNTSRRGMIQALVTREAEALKLKGFD